MPCCNPAPEETCLENGDNFYWLELTTKYLLPYSSKG